MKVCMKLVFSRLNLTANGGMYVERDGQVNVTASEPGIWRWSYFDNPGKT
jgi:hypothetical protein